MLGNNMHISVPYCIWEYDYYLLLNIISESFLGRVSSQSKGLCPNISQRTGGICSSFANLEARDYVTFSWTFQFYFLLDVLFNRQKVLKF